MRNLQRQSPLMWPAVATDVAAAKQQASAEVTDARKDAAKNVSDG